MRKIKEVLRLNWVSGLSNRLSRIYLSTGLHQAVVVVKFFTTNSRTL